MTKPLSRVIIPIEKEKENKTMKEGDRVRVNYKWQSECGATGTLLKIDRNYVPECVVLLDKYADKIPELGIRFCYMEELDKI